MATDPIGCDFAIYGDVADPQSISLAQALEVQLQPISKAPKSWHLVILDGRLELVGLAGLRFALDDTEIERRLMRFSRSGLAKACGASSKPRILDALSGWGTDGVTLAAFGCSVVCCEVIPLVATLNKARALNIAPATQYYCCDAIDFMRSGNPEFDVVYLDDMFPRHPKGARPSKSLQILAELAGNCDLSHVLEEALKVSRDRVVVKRRRNQPPASEKPAWSVEGKTVRFDVYRSSFK